MHQPLYKAYCETVSGKRKFLPENQKLPIFSKDGYESLLRYTEEAAKLAESTGTVSSVKGEWAKRLLFDFDSKENIELAREDALITVKKLIENGTPQESIKTYFSGNKGFHVEVDLETPITHKEFKDIVFGVAGSLSTFDKTINDPNRIVRVVNTKHPESKLFKVPLELYELDELTGEQIRALGASPRQFSLPKTSIKIPDNLLKFKKPEVVKEVKPKVEMTLDLSNRNPQWKPWKWALLQGHFGDEPGERHTALTILAATCRGMGYDKDVTYYLCKSALKKQAQRTGRDEFDKEELWDNIIEKSVFGPNWKGGQYSPENNEWLQLYCDKLGIDWRSDSKNEIKNISEIESDFEHFVKHIDENTIKTGIRTLDENLPITVGNNLGVVGAASSGKTALALEILKNTSKQGVVSVFASLDMHRNRLFEKLLYKETGLSRADLYRAFQEGKGQELTKTIREDYKNVYFYDRSCPSVYDVRAYIKNIEDKTGQKVKLVMVDYFERLNSDKAEDTAASKDVAGALQDLINDFNVAVITLVQPNKFSLSGGPETPITSYTAIKGSSFLYQSFRSILSIWRPFFNPKTTENDKYMQMAILKNDLGELGIYDFSWDGKRGEIKEMEEWQEDQFKSLMQEKSGEKETNWV